MMSESRMRQWCTDFKNDRINVHDETLCGRRNMVTEDLLMKIHENFVTVAVSRLLDFQNIFPEVKFMKFCDGQRYKTNVGEN